MMYVRTSGAHSFAHVVFIAASKRLRQTIVAKSHLVSQLIS